MNSNDNKRLQSGLLYYVLQVQVPGTGRVNSKENWLSGFGLYCVFHKQPAVRLTSREPSSTSCEGGEDAT